MCIPKERGRQCRVGPLRSQELGDVQLGCQGESWGCLCEVVAEAVRWLEDKDAEGQLCQRRDPLRSQGDLAWGWVSNERRHWLAVCLGASYSSRGCLFYQQSLSEVGRGFWGGLFSSLVLLPTKELLFLLFYYVYSAYSRCMSMRMSERVRQRYLLPCLMA